MPRFDGTGPFGDPNWQCKRPFGRATNFFGSGRGFVRHFGQDFECSNYNNFVDFAALTKDEQKKILDAQLKELNLEKQKIEAKLKELK